MERQPILNKYPQSPDHLLGLLHELQDASGTHSLAPEDLKAAADHLRLPYSYVYGVASFYTMFSFKPRGRYLVRICQSPPCHLMGATTLTRELMNQLGVKIGQTTEDGLFTLEMTSCLGVCGIAPAMMIDDEVYGNLTPERIAEIIADKRRDA